MATQRRRWMTVGVLAAGLLLGACGGSDDKSSGGDKPPETTAGPEFVVTAKEFSFSPNTLALKPGPATIVLQNGGSIDHDFSVNDAGFKLVVAANQTGRKALTLDKPGTYEFHCSVPGHKDAGMKGEITVQ